MWTSRANGPVVRGDIFKGDIFKGNGEEEAVGLRLFFFPAILLCLMAAAVRADDAPSTDFALRGNLYIVGPEEMTPYINAAVANFAAQQGETLAPVIAAKGSTAAIREFCGGLGVDFPDVVASTRRMSRAELKICAHNKVEEVIEIGIGYDAIVVVAKHGTEPFNLVPEYMYRALARDIPQEGQFHPNPHQKWKTVHGFLPDSDIKVFVPPAASGGRGISAASGGRSVSAASGGRSLFDDRVMQAGCRSIPEVRAIYAAAERTAKCVTGRSDGRFIEMGEVSQASDLFRDAPDGTMAVVDRSRWVDDAKNLTVFPINGLLPMEQSIASEEYPLSRRLYFYFKKGHMRDRKGFGVAKGLREFMISVTSDEAMEPGGYFERKGLVLLRREDRARQRLEAVSLTPLQR